MVLGVFHLANVLDTVSVLARNTEGHKTASCYRHHLTALQFYTGFVAGIVGYGDGDVLGDTCVHVGRFGHCREVGSTINTDNLIPVVVQDDLREVDVGDGFQQHVQFLDPYVALCIVNESVKLLVDLDCLAIGREELLGLIEGTSISWCLIAGGTGGGVGVSRHRVE